MEDVIKDHIPKKLDTSCSQFLDHTLSIDKLEHVVFSMAANKNPGIDGLSVEFYQIMWKYIKDGFYMVYLKALELGSLGLDINRGLIKLLPKGKNEDTVAGWHPITLLNTSYKIIAKAIPTKMKPVVQSIVLPKQTGFLGGRYILDNLILSWETMEWAQQSSQNAIIVKLDFDKAYN